MQASPRKSQEPPSGSADDTAEGRDGGPAPVQAGSGGISPRLDSRQLFASGREVIIAHDGADYRLRLTQNGKLILTK